ncbi:alpha-ketoglutarate-dependent 2,4-dichlorophenoxyacetate dioxygenase [Salinihabitans flavidus]|uniref:Alpha-ketoglutarate-dependent 2,4-dichlorophenoxyacetate dioxygenase n=1 Tax=Salinihabitans flavidus TaxID=569882 RepID=A0A1H8V3U7_9RHOB|nr:TauD/TfdA family dioxygenase [Salinihabitans flavidus]SEP10066.1 alpha-ketoglutarate-dependent 2,4-dichlorophenoxyacetate dioxygenase [Salinihabitans flavidus]
MSDLETRPLTPAFGVEVSGLDLNTVTADHLFPQLRALFENHSALLFRRQSLTPDAHLRLAGLFGPIEDRKADERKPGEAFEIPEVSNVTGDGTLTTEMDLHTLNLQSNMLWHSDSTFMPVPALCNILTAKTVTTEGGATELACTRAAFADMPEARRERLRNLLFRHHYSQSRRRISPELADLPMFHKWPEQVWPAVLRNPVNGRESVYVASHVRGVVGMDDAAGMALVDALIAECTAPEYVYSHQWDVGDVMLWDQRAVLHRGTPWPYDQPRRLTSICSSMTDADGLSEMRARAGK